MTKKDSVAVERLQFKHTQILDRIFYLKMFTPDQCDKIINTALNTWKETVGMLHEDIEGKLIENSVENPEYRNVTLYTPPNLDDGLFGMIINTIKDFNDSNEGYQFDIVGMGEPPNMIKYSAKDLTPNGKPGKFEWHMDVGIGPLPSIRKLSFSILLNAGDYEGGELVFHTGTLMKPHPDQNFKDFIGTATVFPSYLVHRVLDITKGTRYALVGWLHGNSFR